MRSKRQINVAFADDHILVRKAIINLFSTNSSLNFIIEAGDGIELLEKIQASSIKPDICLLDVKMPRMDGFETLGQLKNKWPQIKVLVLTIFENDIYFTKMVRMGANGYLTKVADPAVLLRAINSIYTTGFYNSDIIAQKLSDSLTDKKKLKVEITETEKILLKLCCSDLTYKEIAERMKVSLKSVEGHRDYLFRKLGVSSRPSLVMYAIQTGIVVIDR